MICPETYIKEERKIAKVLTSNNQQQETDQSKNQQTSNVKK